jgi:hypothetical protein
MLSATFVATFLIPMFFVVIGKHMGRRAEVAPSEAAAPAPG